MTNNVAYGAYVDLGYQAYSTIPSGAPVPQFDGSPPHGVVTYLNPYRPLPLSGATLPAYKAAALNTAQPMVYPVVNPQSPPRILGSGKLYNYDTWSLHYENDGIVQNTAQGNTVPDKGTNGLDDPAPPPGGGAMVTNGIVDDPTEFDTQPPFATSLRGLRVIIRVYEPSSQQVRQVTVVQDFLPE